MIETTGLADPAPILSTLLGDPMLAAHYRADAVVTTVDAANAADQLEHQPESVRQVAVADRLRADQGRPRRARPSARRWSAGCARSTPPRRWSRRGTATPRASA